MAKLKASEAKLQRERQKSKVCAWGGGSCRSFREKPGRLLLARPAAAAVSVEGHMLASAQQPHTQQHAVPGCLPRCAMLCCAVSMQQASQHATKLVGKIDSAFRIDQRCGLRHNTHTWVGRHSTHIQSAQHTGSAQHTASHALPLVSPPHTHTPHRPTAPTTSPTWRPVQHSWRSCGSRPLHTTRCGDSLFMAEGREPAPAEGVHDFLHPCISAHLGRVKLCV